MEWRQYEIGARRLRSCKDGGEIALPDFEVKKEPQEEMLKKTPKETPGEKTSELLTKLLTNPEAAALLKMLTKTL